ncbi:hypothetical protein DM01DRAFT_1138693 [Hesseltinella vesiculosa]|uniref:Uncharacterized protein n=1 Tax=Hesseltinella vesiculosa TaxID=101127 RepID=A0A1X2G7Y5_9FUNG|nr:hypothetical protein DM01DRAFT_1138693 [Hesseltinella vesiculosa]
MYVVMPTSSLKRQNAFIDSPSPLSPTFLDRPGSSSNSDDDIDLSDSASDISFDSAASVPIVLRSHALGDYDPPVQLGIPYLRQRASSLTNQSPRRDPRIAWPRQVRKYTLLFLVLYTLVLLYTSSHRCFRLKSIPTERFMALEPGAPSHFWVPIYKHDTCWQLSYVIPSAFSWLCLVAVLFCIH